MRLLCPALLVLGCLAAAEEPALTLVARNVSIERALANSPTYERLKTRAVAARWIFDVDSADYWEIGIGEDRPTHFIRGETLRIHKGSSAIQRYGYDGRLEQVWLSDYSPVD